MVQEDLIHTVLPIRPTYTLRPYMEGSLQIFILRTYAPIASELLSFSSKRLEQDLHLCTVHKKSITLFDKLKKDLIAMKLGSCKHHEE